MQQYVKDVSRISKDFFEGISLKHLVIKICIIIYSVFPVLNQLGFPLIHLPIITGLTTILVKISQLFSLDWLLYFFFDTPLSLSDIVVSFIMADSRFWTGTFFFIVMYHGPTPIGSFYNGSLYPISFLDLSILIFFEAVIFLCGLILFIISVVHLFNKQVNDQKIVTTGIYKYVRHPQNLALILMALPFALYIPGFYDYGICFGDLFCWFQLIILLTVYSDYMDYKLKQQFPADFSNYYQQTGFFFPKWHSFQRLQFLSVFNDLQSLTVPISS